MSISFDPKKGLIIVPTRLSGPKGDIVMRLALDTGATGSMVNWELVVLLGYDPAVASERIRMTTGSSVEFVPQITVRQIEALGLIQMNYPILCHTLPPTATVDGVLGLDFFRDYRLILDFASGSCTVGKM